MLHWRASYTTRLTQPWRGGDTGAATNHEKNTKMMLNWMTEERDLVFFCLAERAVGINMNLQSHPVWRYDDFSLHTIGLQMHYLLATICCLEFRLLLSVPCNKITNKHNTLILFPFFLCIVFPRSFPCADLWNVVSQQIVWILLYMCFILSCWYCR